MELKTQIVLVATLFIVFAALSFLARSRSAALSRRVRRRRRISSDDDAATGHSFTPQIEPEPDVRRGATPSMLIVVVAILLACAAAVAVLLFG